LKEGKIIGGIASIVKPWWEKQYLADLELFIDPNYHGGGIGKALLRKHIEAAVRKYDVGHVVADATPKTEFPLAWYKKIGFKPIPETELVYIAGNAREIMNNLTDS